MSQAAPEQKPIDAPVWARDEAFPEAPSGWGWLGEKNRPHACASLEELAAAIRDDHRAGIALAWSPDHPRMRLPEEIPGMGDALRTARDRWSRDDLEAATRRLGWFSAALGGLAVWTFYRGFLEAARLAGHSGTTADLAAGLRMALAAVFRSNMLGVALLVFIIFALVPWYQARKRRAHVLAGAEAGFAAAVPAMRFEIWLERQRAPVTMAFLGLIALVWIAQVINGEPIKGDITAAGLVKEQGFQRDYWRLFTAPFLHGNVVHFLMNAAALAYLGKRLENFARWPHLALVFLFAAYVGGEASYRFLDTPSVGASGGLLGWLGFLLVFETLHGRLVPRSSRRRLAAAVILTALLGAIGYRYIDNAAHAGGLIAGAIYAVIVFPKSSSPHRPRTTVTDLVAGGAAMAVLAAAAAFAVVRILGA